MNYTSIFWDWNGTLLDDAEYCVRTVNRSLIKRGLPVLDKKTYEKYFRFPIIDYYRDIGFDFEKENYSELAVEFNENYSEFCDELKLRANAKEVLSVFRSKNIPQFILSASERTVLENALTYYGINQYFDAVSAGDDYLAHGKAERGRLFAQTVAPEGKKLLIGDSIHDVETAKAIGADCVLCRGGHCSEENLASADARVIDNLYELYEIVLGARKQKPSKHGKYRTQTFSPSLENLSFDLNEAEPKNFVTRYKDFYDDLKNTNKTEDW